MKKLVLISSFLLFVAGSVYGQSWPRFFWEQIEAADSSGRFAISGSSLDGEWNTDLKLLTGDFIRIGSDTLATRAYARGNGGGGGGGSFNSFFFGNGSTYSEIPDGDTIQVIGSTDGIDAGISGNDITVSLDLGETSLVSPITSNSHFVFYNASTLGNERVVSSNVGEWIEDELGDGVLQAGYGLDFTYTDGSDALLYEADTTELATQYDISTLGGELWQENGSDIYYSAGQVAIGQTAADYALDVYNASSYIARFEDASNNLRLSTSSLYGNNSNFSIGLGTYGSAFRIYNGADNYSIVLGNSSRPGEALVGIDDSSPDYSLDISTTDGLRLPSGTTLERPFGSNGVIRFNTTTNRYEGYYQSPVAKWSPLEFWEEIVAGAQIGYTDGSDYIYVRPYEINTENSYIGIGANLNGQAIHINSADNYTLSLEAGDQVGINDQTPDYSLDIETTDAILMPVGTDAQRPGTPEVGLIRYNTTQGNIEYYNASGWESPAASGGGGASELSDLSDVNTSTPTDGNVLVADGTDWESRVLDVDDISGLVDNSTINESWWIEGDTGQETGIKADDGYIDFAGGDGITTSWDSGSNTMTFDADAPLRYSGFTEYTTTTSISPVDGAVVFLDANEGTANLTLTINPTNLTTGDRIRVIVNGNATYDHTIATSGAQVFYSSDVDGTSSTLPFTGDSIDWSILLIYDGADFFASITNDI